MSYVLPMCSSNLAPDNYLYNLELKLLFSLLSCIKLGFSFSESIIYVVTLSYNLLFFHRCDFNCVFLFLITVCQFVRHS